MDCFPSNWAGCAFTDGLPKTLRKTAEGEKPGAEARVSLGRAEASPTGQESRCAYAQHVALPSARELHISPPLRAGAFRAYPAGDSSLGYAALS